MGSFYTKMPFKAKNKVKNTRLVFFYYLTDGQNWIYLFKLYHHPYRDYSGLLACTIGRVSKNISKISGNLSVYFSVSFIDNRIGKRWPLPIHINRQFQTLFMELTLFSFHLELTPLLNQFSIGKTRVFNGSLFFFLYLKKITKHCLNLIKNK